MRFIKTKKYGFTLIELIIVIAIIAILAAIAVPAFGQIRQKANVSADLGNARTIYSLVATEIASDNIKIPTAAEGQGTYKISDLPSNVTGKNKIDIEEAIDPSPKVKTYQGYDFYVTIDSNAKVQINVSKDGQSGFGIYPTPTGRYNNRNDEAAGELPEPNPEPELRQ